MASARFTGWLPSTFSAWAASALLIALWDFTVDDALVTARVAYNIAHGVGYRFNTTGPIVDAVTPLGFAYALALFATPSPLHAFYAAKYLGAIAYLISAALLGHWAARLGQRQSRYLPLLLLACSAPLAAWAASGMETGFVTLLCTLALAPHFWALAAAGIAAALRPELLPWALVLCLGTTLARSREPRALLLALLAALTPAFLVGVIRASVFGDAAPLAVLAKPSDFTHGLGYTAGALCGTAVLPMLAAFSAYRRVSGHYCALALSVAAHAFALVLAGGDWMALYRLMVPVIPAALLAACALADISSTRATVARVLGAGALALILVGPTALRARHVGAHRMDLIRRAQPVLAHSKRIAALDVGWVGAASSAEIMDFSGITDRSVALLPGGHTSKRIPSHMLEQRDVDTLILLLSPHARLEQPWWSSRFQRTVEQRVAALTRTLHFEVSAVLPLGGTKQSYVVLRKAVALTPRKAF